MTHASYTDLLHDLIAAPVPPAPMPPMPCSSAARRFGPTPPRQDRHVEQSEGRDLGLRVFVGLKSAIVSSRTIDPTSFAQLADRAVAMARVVRTILSGLADTAVRPSRRPWTWTIRPSPTWRH